MPRLAPLENRLATPAALVTITNTAVVAVVSKPDPANPNYGSGLFDLPAIAYGSFDQLTNSGTITATGYSVITANVTLQASAFGIDDQNSLPVITNSGTISAVANGPNSKDTGGAWGVLVWNGCTLNNKASGVIRSSGGSTSIAVEVNGGQTFAWQSSQPTITNAGLIEADASLTGAPSIAVLTTNNHLEMFSLVNSGTITGDYAFVTRSPDALGNLNVPSGGGQSITNTATGVMNGLIQMGAGTDVLANAGTINGNVTMGMTKNTVTDTGVINGVVDMGRGNGTFDATGSSHGVVVYGDIGDNIITGSSGADLIVAGLGTDTLFGGGGNDGLYGGPGNDTIETKDGCLVVGGTGNDLIKTDDYTFAKIDGGGGFNTWQLASGTRGFDLAAIAASGRVLDIQDIALGSGKSLTVHAADIAGITGGQTALYLTGASGSTIYLPEAWTASGTTTLNGVTLNGYTFGGKTLWIDPAATISTKPPATAGGGLDAVAGGAAAPLPGAYPGLNLTGTVNLAPTVQDVPIDNINTLLVRDFTVVAGATYTGNNGITLGYDQGVPPMEYPATLTYAFTNNGTISNTGTGSGDSQAFFSVNNTTFRNTGTISADAQGSGSATGAWVVTGTTQAVNTGVISARAQSGGALALVLGGEGPGFDILDNKGTITATSAGGEADGVTSQNFCQWTNDGTVSVNGGNGALAVNLGDNAVGSTDNSFTNNGTIIAKVAQTSQNAAIGVAINGTLNNTGTITGEYSAIVTASDSSYAHATINNSGTMNGDILEVTTFWAKNSSLLSMFDLNNAATGQINGSVSVDPGEVWGSNIVNQGVITGDITLAGGNDVIDTRGGTVLGTIDGGGGVDTVILSGKRSDYTLSALGDGSIDVTANSASVPGGSYNLRSIEVLQFADMTLRMPTGLDFNGDQVGDVLFRMDGGLLATWEPAGNGLISGGGNLGTPAAGSWLVGAANLSGSGRSDLLFRSADGTLTDWAVDGTATTPGALGNPGADWVVAGTGDFTGPFATQVADALGVRTDSVLLYDGKTGAYADWALNTNGTWAATAIGTPAPKTVEKAVADFNGDGKADVLFENSAGVYSIWQMDGATITATSTLGNPGTAWFFKGTGDFNGDGKQDLLFENSAGTYRIWELDGAKVIGDISLGNPGAKWTLAGIGDYNGDGTSDLLFRNIDGGYSTWLVQNGKVTGGSSLGNPGADTRVATTAPQQYFAVMVFQDLATSAVTTWMVSDGKLAGGGKLGMPGTAWTAVATGDFAATGETDVLFRNTNGKYAIWATNGVHRIDAVTLGSPGAGWNFLATGDFNGDGKTDLLFRNSTTGVYATWDIADGHLVGGGSLGTAAGYTFVTTADLTGNGSSDIVFKDAAGTYSAWLINDTTITGGGTIGNPGAGWTFKGSGDFNGDGQADLLFENAAGTYETWDMNGTKVIGGGTIGNPGSDWHLATIMDVNHDGTADLVFENSAGKFMAWTLNDFTVTGSSTIGTLGKGLALV